MADLDAIDLRILRALQQNGRITTLLLAEQVGLSATPCARRVKNLEDEGFIDRYVTLLNASKLDAGLDVFVSIKLRSPSNRECEEFEVRLQSMPEVAACYLLAGAFDYLIHVRVADVERFGFFLRNRLTTLDIVADTQSTFVIQRLKHTTAIALPTG